MFGQVSVDTVVARALGGVDCAREERQVCEVDGSSSELTSKPSTYGGAER